MAPAARLRRAARANERRLSLVHPPGITPHGDAASSRVLSQGGGASSSATMTRRDAASPCVAGPLDDLLDKQPAVVEVRVRRLGRDLLHAAAEVVVAVGDENVNIFDWPHMRAFTEINLAGLPRGRRQVR